MTAFTGNGRQSRGRSSDDHRGHASRLSHQARVVLNVIPPNTCPNTGNGYSLEDFMCFSGHLLMYRERKGQQNFKKINLATENLLYFLCGLQQKIEKRMNERFPPQPVVRPVVQPQRPVRDVRETRNIPDQDQPRT